MIGKFGKRAILRSIRHIHGNRFITILSIFILLICLEIYSESSLYPGKTITGTFYQPSKTCPLVKDPEKWETLFKEMKDLNMDTIIIQWIVRDDTAYYSTELPWIKQKSTNTLRIIFDQAEKCGFRVIIGLYFSDLWWKQEKDHLTKDVFTKNCEIIREIKARHLPNPCFSGWYLPQEISNYTTTLPYLKDEIRTFLKEMSRIRDEETSGATISLAPFFNAQNDRFSSPPEFGEWWKQVAEGTGLNIIMLQDGVGAHPVPWEKMTDYFSALNHSLQGSGIEIWSDLEIFQRQGEGETRSLKPASFERVKKQMLLESPLVNKIVCFAYPNYAFSILGMEQRTLHESYKNYIQSIGNIRIKSNIEGKKPR